MLNRLSCHWVGIVAGVSGMALAVGCGGANTQPETPQTVETTSSDSPVASTSPAARPAASEVPGLKDPATREQTVKDLIAEFDQVAANGTKTDEALAFVDRYAEALTNAYVEGHADLSPETRTALINLLLSFDDKRTIDAHAAAISNYADTGKGVDDAIWACRAAQKFNDERLAKALLSAFEKIDMSDKDARRFSRHLGEAMLVNSSSSWSRIMIEKLAAKIQRPDSFNDKPAVREFQNQLFWQSMAARLLGDLSDSQAPRALLLASLDNTKRDVHAHAELALLKHGQGSVKVAERLLQQQDADLVAKSKADQPELAEPHIFHAAELLAKLAHPSSRPALEAAWEDTNDRVSRVMLALALAKLPRTDKSLEIWQKTYVTTQLSVTLPRGESALEAMAESAPFWFSTQIVPWLDQRTASAPGKGSRKGDLQRALVMSISQLVQKDQVKAANKVAQQYGGRTGTPAFNEAVKLLNECADKLECYMGKVSGSGMTAAKSAITIGLQGKEAQRDALVKLVVGIEDRKLQETVSRVIEHLAAGAESQVAKQLEKTVLAEGSVQAENVTPAALLYYRLRSR